MDFNFEFDFSFIEDMFKPDELDLKIAKLESTINNDKLTDDEMDKTVKLLNELVRIRNEKHKGDIDPIAVAQIVAGLVGLGAVLNFENTGVITTKALGFVGSLFKW